MLSVVSCGKSCLTPPGLATRGVGHSGEAPGLAQPQAPRSGAHDRNTLYRFLPESQCVHFHYIIYLLPCLLLFLFIFFLLTLKFQHNFIGIVIPK